MITTNHPSAPTAARLAYGGSPSQFGDLWLAAGHARDALVVFFHGGYWRARYDLLHAAPFCQSLAQRGIPVWNVEYRRVGESGGGWPGTFADVLAALRYLPELARRHSLSLQRVVLCGHSAGGHLALWAGAMAAREQATPGLRSVVALAAVSDLHAAWERHLSQDAVVGLLGGSPAEVPERYEAASPTHLLPLGLTQALIHGDADEDVPFDLSRQYVERARALGDDARLVVLPGEGHFAVIDPESPAWPVVVRELESLLADG